MGTRPDPEARPSANSMLGAQIGRVRVGRLPTAPSQQTIVSALLRGAPAAGSRMGAGDCQGRPPPPPPPPGNGQWESWRLDMEIPDASS